MEEVDVEKTIKRKVIKAYKKLSPKQKEVLGKKFGDEKSAIKGLAYEGIVTGADINKYIDEVVREGITEDTIITDEVTKNRKKAFESYAKLKKRELEKVNEKAKEKELEINEELNYEEYIKNNTEELNVGFSKFEELANFKIETEQEIENKENNDKEKKEEVAKTEVKPEPESMKGENETMAMEKNMDEKLKELESVNKRIEDLKANIEKEVETCEYLEEKVKDIEQIKILEARDKDDMSPNDIKKLNELKEKSKKRTDDLDKQIEDLKLAMSEDLSNSNLDELEKKMSELKQKKEISEVDSLEKFENFYRKSFDRIRGYKEEEDKVKEKNEEIGKEILSHPDMQAFEKKMIRDEILKERDQEIKSLRNLREYKVEKGEYNTLGEVEALINEIPKELQNNPAVKAKEKEFKALKMQYLGAVNEEDKEYEEEVLGELKEFASNLNGDLEKIAEVVKIQMEENIKQYEVTAYSMDVQTKENPFAEEPVQTQEQEEIEEVEETALDVKKPSLFARAKGWFSGLKAKIKNRFSYNDEEEIEEQEQPEPTQTENETQEQTHQEPTYETTKSYERLTEEEQKEAYDRYKENVDKNLIREKMEEKLREAKERAMSKTRERVLEEKMKEAQRRADEDMER